MTGSQSRLVGCFPFSFSLVGSRGKGQLLACRDYITLSGQARTGAHCPPRNEMSYKTFLVENRCAYVSLTKLFLARAFWKRRKTNMTIFKRHERIDGGFGRKWGLQVTFLLYVRFPGSLPARFHHSITSSESRKQERGAAENFVTFS